MLSVALATDGPPSLEAADSELKPEDPPRLFQPPRSPVDQARDRRQMLLTKPELRIRSTRSGIMRG